MQQEMHPREGKWDKPLYVNPESQEHYGDGVYDSYNQGLRPESPAPAAPPTFSSSMPGANLNLGRVGGYHKASSGQRLALAIVSVAMLVPLSAISLASG